MSGAALVRSDATAIPLGDETVDAIITSPPYFALRSYQDGGEHYDGQIGSEATPSAFLEALWAVTAECWRVLKPTGSLFVNLGDKYAGSGGHNNAGLAKPHTGSITFASQERNAASRPTRRSAPDRYNQASDGIRAKSLMGLPWRYAIGCIDGQADPDGKGWVLRSEIVWSKPNGMPESVTDRVRRSHEQWFHFTKNGTYYANVDEVREPHTGDASGLAATFCRPNPSSDLVPGQAATQQRSDRPDVPAAHPLGKVPGSVWTVPTQPLIVPDWLDVDHFAAFPTEWPRRLILGWTPPGICVECGDGRRAVTEHSDEYREFRRNAGDWNQKAKVHGRDTTGNQPSAASAVPPATKTITGHACACDKPTAPTTPAVVLDPFGGTGTVALVARALGRYGVSCDLSADYQRLARWRIWQSGQAARVAAKTDGERQLSMFQEVAAAP